MDEYQRGFWCVCDGYTYLSNEGNQHKFTLLLEDKQAKNVEMPACDIKFNKRISPLRWAGGKSKIIPYVYAKMQKDAVKTLVGAFAGGASIELAMLNAGIVENLILNDFDFGVYALFWTIKHAPYDLIYRIQTSKPTHEDYFCAQEVLKSDYNSCTILDAAWALLLNNRLAYSGIFKANPLGGRNGDSSKLLSRWNPDSLCKRINLIHSMSDRITITNLDACELIEEVYYQDRATLFVDPPYYKQGKNLYRVYYTKEQHLQLNELLDSLHHGMPGADIILFYDNDPFIEDIYWYPTIEKISRVFSV
ncbi:DNA methyltransferase [Paenibacillus sp. Leaf72]|nr:DNA methyltransferase [Paenibacillus sp. Leaf72]